ncbi:hypothetical protein [Streptomyces sp. NPDC058401]
MLQIPVERADSEPGTGTATKEDSSNADLLDRALVGWELFLSSFEGVSDE